MKSRRRIAFESNRQWFHILFGGVLLTVAVLLGSAATLVLYAAGLFFGLFILHAKLSGWRLLFFDWVLKKWERRNVLFPGQGAVLYFAGALFVL
ncbi:MAG: hypothetical protein Q8P02_01950, partial [Candidatus Micrarchaeota archaeon]|nr:hypothetical protein [Candidatus Micrarchaeota archaeon]